MSAKDNMANSAMLNYCPHCLGICQYDSTLDMHYCNRCDAHWDHEEIIWKTNAPIRRRSEIKNEWKEKYGDKEDI
jgi:hypothetical protein